MIPPEDLEIKPYPDRGKGGQHVGVEHGVQITHLPTGTRACCNSGRSQLRNKEIAMDMILSALTHPKFTG